ncbi:MAG: Response regulator UvrY [Verrucomicrobiae bacterium]|nr:Response regulator UvrY [Verrucomicrobiae bacterium]
MRFLLVDDHAVVRAGVRLILAAAYPAATFGEAGTVSQAVDLLSSAPWDVVITDITMPGRSGLDLLKTIKVVRPRLPVLVLSVHAEDQFAIRVIKAGAAGYLNKDSAPDELVGAVKKVMAGHKYISGTLAETLAADLLNQSDGAPHTQLSDREYEVFRLLAAGKTVKEIAFELVLSVKTISTYRTRILTKLNRHNNADLMRYAVQHGLLD